MAWTTPVTVVTGAVIPASWGNTYVRDNTAHLMGLLDGTGSGTVTVPGTLVIAGNANYSIGELTSDRPYMGFDNNDYLEFTRSTNTFKFNIAGSAKLNLDTNGKLTGAGFYASSIFSLAAGGIVSQAHGLGARPRFVGGYYDLTNNDAAMDTPVTPNAGAGTDVAIYLADATNLGIRNGTASTMYIRVYAMI